MEYKKVEEGDSLLQKRESRRCKIKSKILKDYLAAFAAANASS